MGDWIAEQLDASIEAIKERVLNDLVLEDLVVDAVEAGTRSA